MADLKKTIKGLECCSLEPERLKDCRYHGCPYSDLEGKGEFENFDCMASLARDALSLLKAKEPRVMSLEELQTAEECMEPVFVEMLDEKGKPGDTPDLFSWRFVRHITPATDGKIYMLMNYGFNSALWTETYNATWRCWNERPTEEQRKGAAWE